MAASHYQLGAIHILICEAKDPKTKKRINTISN